MNKRQRHLHGNANPVKPAHSCKHSSEFLYPNVCSPSLVYAQKVSKLSGELPKRMTQEQALTPRAERLVNFYGDQITVALVGEDEPYVSLRTLAAYLGLEWPSQYRRVQCDSALARSIRTELRRPDTHI